jgi:hypothetical protein
MDETWRAAPVPQASSSTREARLVSLGEMNDRASNRSKSIIVW